MKISSLTKHDLASFAENLVTLLAGTELSAIDSHVRADLITAFGTLPATLATQADAATVAEEVKKSANSDRNDTTALVQDLSARVRDALTAGRAPKGQFDLAGFDYPFTRASTYTAQAPTALSGFGTSNGVNTIVFTGNNKRNVVYEIWRRQGDTAPWGIVATTKRQTHEDRGVTPGQYYEYKVRAVAASNVSNFSNSAVVYGTL